ncbi:glycosyltransferase [Planctomicrobium sp. SH668]|uniref:glycosyltransferase n=1 Tax=Planctomicrobium sp. SH668 TaxID=3448126 RepID=UPI003F5BA284
MYWFVGIFLGAASIVISIHLYWTYKFVQLLKSSSIGRDEIARSPRTLVVMALRGADPFLGETLLRLASQSYRNFTIRIIVDSETDPAWEPLSRFLDVKDRPRTEVQILRLRRTNCSLKASALIQALTNLEPEYEVIVQLDADAVPYPDWLLDMVAPMVSRPEVGVVSGLRWYVAPKDNWAARLRQIWGAGAMIQMHALDMVWGGSLGIRRTFLDESNLLGYWSHSISDDMVTTSAIRSTHYKIAYVPAILSNHERTTIPSSFEFISRQLFQARWHNESWTYVSLMTNGSNIAVLSALAAIGMAAISGDWGVALGVLALLIVVVDAVGRQLRWAERHVRVRLHHQGETVSPIGLWHFFCVYPAGILSGLCFVKASLSSRIVWRGVVYDALGLQQFRLVTDNDREMTVNDQQPVNCVLVPSESPSAGY